MGHHWARSLLMIIPAGLMFVLLPRLSAQSQTAEASGRESAAGWIWSEQLAGSTNSYGQVLATTSSAGYNFNSHFGVIGGIPVYFVHNSTSTAGASSLHGVGDVFASLRMAWGAPVGNYRMTLTGAAPSGDSSKGLGTGRATFDWTHHLDREFGRWTPFAQAGLTNSPSQFIPAQRQFVSTGHAAHFELGSALRVAGPVSVSASFYDIEPWGAQTVLSRVVTPNGPPAGAGGHGRVFEVSQQTVGGSSLTRDHGINAGLSAGVARFVEVWAAFNRSTQLDLNTVTFGIGVNVSGLIDRAN